MKYRKIHIIGGAGSGKTYTARKLAKLTGILCVELDDIFWDTSYQGYVKAPVDVRTKNLDLALERESWIIEGSYYKWLDRSFELADIVVILDVPLGLRQIRVIWRYIFDKLKNRSAGRETISGTLELLRWNVEFDKNIILRIHERLFDYEYKVVRCNSYEGIRRLFADT